MRHKPRARMHDVADAMSQYSEAFDHIDAWVREEIYQATEIPIVEVIDRVILGEDSVSALLLGDAIGVAIMAKRKAGRR